MTGIFQIKKQNDGGVQELIELDTKVVLNVNDPVAFSTDGTIKAYASGDEIVGVNNSEMVAPEFYEQVDLDAVGTTPLKVLISPVKHNSLVEVLPSVTITDEATIKAEIGTKVDLNASLEVVLGTSGTDAQIVDYMKYTAKDGALNINPIVKFLSTQY